MTSMRQGRRRPNHARAQRGFTYIAVLVGVAIVGIGLSAAMTVWQRVAERQRLEELDWIGEQYVHAIGSYYDGTAGIVVKSYARSFQDLLRDDRFVGVRRHLRRLYPNPFTGTQDFGIVAAPDGGIRGVHVEFSLGESAVSRDYVFTPGVTR